MTETTTDDVEEVCGLSNSGQVPGITYNGDGNAVALRWEANGDVTGIGLLGMGYVRAINDSGHVAGDFLDEETFSERVSYWDGTTMTMIDVLPGGDEGVGANEINAFGDVFGISEGDDERGSLYSDSVMSDLNSLAAGFLIDDRSAYDE